MEQYTKSTPKYDNLICDKGETVHLGKGGLLSKHCLGQLPLLHTQKSILDEWEIQISAR